MKYAISSTIPLEISEGNTIPFFLMATLQPITMEFSGESAVLAQLANSSIIHIRDAQGTTLWSGNSINNYLHIQDTEFSITQEPPLFLYPINPEKTNQPLHLSLSPAELKDMKIQQLLQDVSSAASQFEQMNLSSVIKNIDSMSGILSAATTIANGAMVLVETNDTVTVDHTSQRFIKLGFVRFNNLEVTYPGGSAGPTINGDHKLIFLGDHFYNPQAKNSKNGILFPFELLIIWVIALCIYFYVSFFVRPDINEDKDEKIKRYALIFHIILLVVAFLLIDRAVSSQFGISALDALFSQGISFFFGVFLGLELFLWVLGFVFLAIPVRIMTNAGLRFLGIGKGGKGIGKGVGALFIWVFCVVYMTLFLNIMASMINLGNMISLG
jgi:hypothetical protein